MPGWGGGGGRGFEGRDSRRCIDMETILGKRRLVSWKDAGGKAQDLKRLVAVRPDVHEALKKRAAVYGVSMGEVVRRMLALDVPLLKKEAAVNMPREMRERRVDELIGTLEKIAKDVRTIVDGV